MPRPCWCLQIRCRQWQSFGQINFILPWEKGTGRFTVFDVYVRTNLSLIDSQIRAPVSKRRHPAESGERICGYFGTVSDRA